MYVRERRSEAILTQLSGRHYNRMVFVEFYFSSLKRSICYWKTKTKHPLLNTLTLKCKAEYISGQGISSHFNIISASYLKLLFLYQSIHQDSFQLIWSYKRQIQSCLFNTITGCLLVPASSLMQNVIEDCIGLIILWRLYLLVTI